MKKKVKKEKKEARKKKLDQIKEQFRLARVRLGKRKKVEKKEERRKTK